MNDLSRVASYVPVGLNNKNLFVKDKKSKQLFLLMVAAHKRVNLAKLAKVFGVKKMSMASHDTLTNVLNIDPGSVSPLALMNDKLLKVRCVVDQDLWRQSEIRVKSDCRDVDGDDGKGFQMHPLVNDETLVISREGFVRFMCAIHHELEFVEIPSDSSAP